MNFKNITSNVSEDFSGVVFIKDQSGQIHHQAYGYANRSDEIKNKVDTKFGIASGCKFFTAVAISQLVDAGKITFQSKIKDCLDIEFPFFDDSVTVHHLLTHTSGIPDYFDEAVMEDFADLWKERPMYLIDHLQAFLPMFQNSKMMFSPGERFQYNNAGFIVLGLIVEQYSGMSFTDYVETHIFKKCPMNDSGYYSLDQFPKNTAIGYIDDEETGLWKTNIYSIPIKGGADGGAFITAPDMIKFWEGLLSHKLLNPETTKLLLTPHVCEEDDEYYGYGIWITKSGDEIVKYHLMGYDPGVCFHSAYYPKKGITVVIPSNKSKGAYPVIKMIESQM